MLNSPQMVIYRLLDRLKTQMSKACIDRSDSWIFQHKRRPRVTKYKKYILGSHPRGGGYSHTLPIQVCAAQRGRDFEAPDLERGIHFRGVF